VTQDPTTFRSKDQVLYDLAKAMRFSPESLAANRGGRLSGQQVKEFAGRLSGPTIVAVVFTLAPFVFWLVRTSAQEQVSFEEAIPILLRQLVHVGQMMESFGKLGTLFRLGSIAVCLVVAAIAAIRISPALYFDLLERSIVAREARINAREEQTIRPNGRDPIEVYFFETKTDRYEVNLAAYRALEDGSVYRLYLLPRSKLLVSLEPKVSD
jgi:hypothetical protein